MSGRGPGAVLVALALVLAGCEVPNNDSPQALPGPIPFGLTETTTTTTTSTVVPFATTREVWFLTNVADGGTRLVEVSRELPPGSDERAVLFNLFTVRPSGEERPAEEGLFSSIPESAALVSAFRDADNPGRLVVDVRGLFGSEGIEGVELRNALAQIVYTATGLPDVVEVVFRNDGEPVAAAIDDGATAEGAVTRDSYARNS